MSDLASLIERIEQAEGPDAYLDDEIAVALGFAQQRGLILYRLDPVKGSTREIYRSRRYTASIDAALTLVPDWFGEFSWSWMVTNTGENDQPQACVTSPPENDGVDYVAEAATPALALCAAALRARETSQ